MKVYLFLLALLAFAPNAFAENQPLDKEKWEKLSRDLNYEQEKEEPKEIEETESTRESYRPSSSGASFGDVKYLFMAIVVVLLIVLIVFMIANSKANPNLQSQRIAIEKMDKIEEHIHEVNLEDIFDDFVKAGDYTMAIRISFLKIIKALSEQKMIKWEKQKTNWEYHSELNDHDLRTEFAQMISHFEKVWYGEIQLTEPEFIEVNELFENFKSKHLNIEQAA
jgi:cell division protein FtsL